MTIKCMKCKRIDVFSFDIYDDTGKCHKVILCEKHLRKVLPKEISNKFVFYDEP